jgi:hypothetical protein
MHPFDIENSIENLIVQNRVRGFSFYLIILFVLIGALAALPFIFVDVSSKVISYNPLKFAKLKMPHKQYIF